MEPRRPRRQSPDIRREQILDAAAAVLLRRGLHQTTVSDVAEAASLGKGTVYLYFDSKQALLAGLRRRYVAEIEAYIRSQVAASVTPEERLTALVRGLVTAASGQQELHHLLFHEAGFDEEDAFAPVRAVFAEVIGSGFGIDDATLLTDFVLGGVHAALPHAVHAAPAQRRRMIDEIATLVIRAVEPQDG